ncbi:MAG: SEC-C metal-binding domain-containing protein, partial [Spirochaetota bacterium]
RGAVTIATNMAGRGTDIKLGGNLEFRARKKSGTDASPEDFWKVYENELEVWRKDYEAVKNAGGLYVLGTERHESRRIDNQLRGRSGRQGDPGNSRFFISLDDELWRLFGGENLKSFMSRVGMRDGEPIFHPWINKSIERAQKRVEERNYEIRKHLLEYDDVLNEQRKFIYAQRDAILADNNLSERVLNGANEIVMDNLDTYYKNKETSPSSFTEFLESLKENFFYNPSVPEDKIVQMQFEELQEYILKDLKADIQNKALQIGEENLNLFIRFEYLRNIDSRWQDHLENMEALREAVYLRAYGQKNPLLEYKLEGFEIFDKLIQDIRSAIAKKVLKVKIQAYGSAATQTERVQSVKASHSAMHQFGNANPTPPQESSPEKVQVRRAYPKVGRNDPCPCGSGKKYKHCHGR